MRRGVWVVPTVPERDFTVWVFVRVVLSSLIAPARVVVLRVARAFVWLLLLVSRVALVRTVLPIGRVPAAPSRNAEYAGVPNHRPIKVHKIRSLFISVVNSIKNPKMGQALVLVVSVSG